MIAGQLQTGARAALRRPERLLWVALVLALLVSFSGTLYRPAGPAWGYAYDLGAYNVVYVVAAVLCWRRAAPTNGARALAVALLCNVVGNLIYTSVVARMDPEPFPSVADAFYLLLYPFLYVAVVGAVRARVSRMLPSMWLDGLVAGLGAAAVATAALLGPALALAGENGAAVATNLAYPVADLLLLALLVAAAAVLGLRADRGLVLIAAGLALYLLADLRFLQQVADGTYVQGGFLDQVWLLGPVAMALSATVPVRGQAASVATESLGWHVLAVPVLCSLASGAVLAVGFGSRLPQIAGWCAALCWCAGLVRTGLTFREIRDLRDVQQQARTDALTGLPNRRALYERWAGRPVRDGTSCLLLFDLDGFKDVNDTFGHHTGDQLLREVALRIQQTVHAPALTARLGGDEFAVLLPGGAHVGAAVAARLQGALAPAFVVDGVRLHVGASYGVSADEETDGDLGDMLRRADVAMYEAKRTRTGVAVFSVDLGNGMADRLRTVDELRTGLQERQLLVHLQPLVEPGSGAVRAVEALVRWQHPERGLLSPADLLPAAEQAGLMGQLAAEVLELSLSAVARWWATAPVPVSINLSVADIADLDLPRKVAEALRRHQVPAAALTVELVEDSIMSDPARAAEVLTALRAMGVAVAIDDYGTGYSSLAYLHDIPADQLKIDRAFTARMLTSERTRLILLHTVALAHSLGLEVVAEGVEDQQTLEALHALGCDLVQGFHTGRPAPLEQVLPLLLGSRPPVPLPVQPGARLRTA